MLNPVSQQIRGKEYLGERRAQLVRGDGHKLRLHLVEALKLLVRFPQLMGLLLHAALQVGIERSQFLNQATIFQHQAAVLECPLDDGAQLVKVLHRLEQIVVRTFAQRADGRLERGMAGKDDDFGIGGVALTTCSTPRPSRRGICRSLMTSANPSACV